MAGRDHSTSERGGFTLVELIVIIVILGILAGVAIPRYIDYSSRAGASATARSLKIISRAIDQYRIDFSDFLPANTSPATMPQELSAYLEPEGFRTVYAGSLIADWDSSSVSSPSRTAPAWLDVIPSNWMSVGVTAPIAPVQAIDALIDDGNTTTGRARYQSNWGQRFGIMFVP